MSDLNGIGVWENSWAWGVPLIVLTVIIHVIGLALIRTRVAGAFDRHPAGAKISLPRFAWVMGIAVMFTTVLHVLQALVWAAAFVGLGALPDMRSAMLYSLGAMTTYGHATVFLDPAWQMLGALEALNGAILIGLTTAFLYSMIQTAFSGRGW